MRRVATKHIVVLVVAAAMSHGLAACQGTERLRAWDEEAARVASFVRLLPDATVADVGAGDGGLAMSLARHLAPGARVYATEIDPALLERLRHAVAERGLANVTVVEGAQDDTRLPAECCEAIVLRAVYRYVTNPLAIGPSLAQALVPGGRLAIIEPPVLPDAGAAGDGSGGRAARGVTAATVVSELMEASLELVRVVPDWNNEGYYAVLMRKPGRPAR